VFIDLWNDASNATSTALRIAVSATTSTDTMNLVTVNRFDVYGGDKLTNSTAVHLEGSLTSYGDARNCTFTNMNIEDVKFAYRLERARNNTFNDLNYTRVLTGGAFIKMDANSLNNSFENLYASTNNSATVDLVLDSNTDASSPNMLRRVTGWQGSGVTINATLASNTILEQINLSGNSPTVDADITNRNNTRTWAGGYFSSWFRLPYGTSTTVDEAGEMALDTSGNQLIVANGSNTERAVPIEDVKIWSVTVASTSQAFIDSGLLPIPTQIDGYTITRIQCHVTGGTSKIVAVEDASANSSEDITCATTNTTDDGSITNATYTASELPYIDFGATSGAVDYVTVSAFGVWTRE
jgi:hypothetical protein